MLKKGLSEEETRRSRHGRREPPTPGPEAGQRCHCPVTDWKGRSHGRNCPVASLPAARPRAPCPGLSGRTPAPWVAPTSEGRAPLLASSSLIFPHPPALPSLPTPCSLDPQAQETVSGATRGDLTPKTWRAVQKPPPWGRDFISLPEISEPSPVEGRQRWRRVSRPRGASLSPRQLLRPHPGRERARLLSW